MKWYIYEMILGMFCIGLLGTGCSDSEDENYGKSRQNTAEYPNAQLIHPGCMFGKEDLDYLTMMAEKESASYYAFRTINSAKMGYIMEGPFETVGCENQNHSVQYENDMTAVLHQSIQWYMTGYDQYAKNAMNILRAWATTHKYWDGPTVHLIAGEWCMEMAAGAEILRSCYPGWESDLNGILKDYFMNVIWETIGGNKEKKTLEVLHSANQGAVEIRGALAIAVFLDDKEMFNNIIDAALYHPSAGLTQLTLENGQFADFGRDMGHAGGMLMDWARISEIAWHQNVDLYGVLGNRLMKCIEYFCEYNVTDIDWSSRYKLFGAGYSWYRGPSSDKLKTDGEAGVAADRKNHDNNFLTSFCLYRGAYETRKGLPDLTYTTQYAADVISHKHKLENVFLYTRTKHSESTAVIPAIKIDMVETEDNPMLSTIGNTNEVNLEVQDGTYNLRGRGYNSSSSSLAYFEMESDGALIVRIDEPPLSENNSMALAGLMIRESMDESSLHDWIYIGDKKDGNAIVKFYSNTKYNNSDINVGRGFTPGESQQQYPVWLKLERRNGRICSYDSYDGNTWVVIDRGFRYAGKSVWPDKYYLGLVVTSNSPNKDMVTAKFADVKLLKYNN